MLQPDGCSRRKREKRGGEEGFAGWRRRSLLLRCLTTAVSTETEVLVATACFVAAVVSAIGPRLWRRRRRNKSEGKKKEGGNDWREEERGGAGDGETLGVSERRRLLVRRSSWREEEKE